MMIIYACFFIMGTFFSFSFSFFNASCNSLHMLEPSVVVLFTFVVASDFYRRFQTSSFPLPFTKENRFWIERLRGFKSESVWGKIRPRDVETSSSLEKLRIQDESISNIPRDLSSLSKLFRNSCHDLGRGNSANLPTIPQPRSSVDGLPEESPSSDIHRRRIGDEG